MNINKTLKGATDHSAGLSDRGGWALLRRSCLATISAIRQGVLRDVPRPRRAEKA